MGNCPSSTKPAGQIGTYYNLEFTNNGGWWHKQFGWNEQGLLQMYIVCSIPALMGFAAHVYSLRQLRASMGQVHPIVRCLTVLGALFTTSLFSLLVHYFIYANNGQ